MPKFIIRRQRFQAQFPTVPNFCQDSLLGKFNPIAVGRLVICLAEAILALATTNPGPILWSESLGQPVFNLSKKEGGKFFEDPWVWTETWVYFD